MEMFKVGGCIRDSIMGIPSKDIDFTCVLIDTDEHEGWLLRPGQGNVPLTPFQAMEWQLKRRGFDIFLSSPEFFTIRARFPKGHENAGMTADFVLARKDGPSTDGRRPDFVEAGTLIDDLARRDFTMNAIAEDVNGNIIDPFGGRQDITDRLIVAVGKAEDRFAEDALRGLRALRFCVTKGFKIHPDTFFPLTRPWFAEALSSVSKERQREEMEKMFAHDTLASLEIFSDWRLTRVREVVFSDGLRLSATMKG